MKFLPIFAPAVLAIVLQASTGGDATLNEISTHKIRKRLTGGSENEITETPWIASIKCNSKHICGGTIISSLTILTTESCLKSRRLSDIFIRLGHSDCNEPGDRYNTYRATDSNVKDGIALLYVDRAIVFSERVAKVKLASGEYVFTANSIGIIAGWGMNFEKGDACKKPLRSNKVNVGKFENSVCKYVKSNEVIKDAQICTIRENYGKGVCKLDNGGPLIVDGVQVGVIISDNDCGFNNNPVAYANVASFYDWIEKNMKE